METGRAIEALGAMAHATRLEIFRHLIRRGPEGMTAGSLAEKLAVPPSTLSHHLSLLERAGLLRSWRVQRQIFYASDYAGTRALLAFLTEDCCAGRPEICEGLDITGSTLPAGNHGPYHVLFLCTGNSARSIMAESILNKEGQGKFVAYSAGSQPAGQVNPVAVDTLKSLEYPTQSLRSKSWDEFAGDDAPQMDFIFTVCDNAAGETCPAWPGQPITAHWGFRDPADFDGPALERRAVFLDVFRQIQRQISAFINLPFGALDELAVKRHLDDLSEHQNGARQNGNRRA